MGAELGEGRGWRDTRAEGHPRRREEACTAWAGGSRVAVRLEWQVGWVLSVSSAKFTGLVLTLGAMRGT